MSLQDLMRVHALKIFANPLSETLLEASIKAGKDADKWRNVQAAVSTELFDAVENCCQMLGITKRAFIEAALIEAVNVAEREISAAAAASQAGVR